jgi:D-alanyl-D-alanine dipeptidase
MRYALLVTLLAAPLGAQTSADTTIVRDRRTFDSLMADVRSLDTTIAVEAKYFGSDNFTGRPLPGYDADRAYLRKEAVAALTRVQARLRRQHLGLIIYDGYRPVRATEAMVTWAESVGRKVELVDGGYIASRSRHNLGLAVDLTVIDLRTRRPLEMGTPYDTFSEAAHTANATGEAAKNRKLLVDAMTAEGFENYDQEWWHFLMRLPSEPRFDVPVR